MQRVREAPLPCSSHWVLLDLTQTVLSSNSPNLQRQKTAAGGGTRAVELARSPLWQAAHAAASAPRSMRQAGLVTEPPGRNAGAAPRRGHVRRTLCAHVCEGEPRGAGPAEPACVNGYICVYMGVYGCICAPLPAQDRQPAVREGPCTPARTPPAGMGARGTALQEEFAFTGPHAEPNQRERPGDAGLSVADGTGPRMPGLAARPGATRGPARCRTALKSSPVCNRPALGACAAEKVFQLPLAL